MFWGRNVTKKDFVTSVRLIESGSLDGCVKDSEAAFRLNGNWYHD